MTVKSTADGLGLTIPALFARAHRAYGRTEREAIHSDIQKFEDRGIVPEYVQHFAAAYDRHKGQLQLRLVVNNEA